MKPDITPEKKVLEILLATTRLIRAAGTARDAQAAVRYAARFNRRLAKITR